MFCQKPSDIYQTLSERSAMLRSWVTMMTQYLCSCASLSKIPNFAKEAVLLTFGTTSLRNSAKSVNQSRWLRTRVCLGKKKKRC
jgi:hypothetical protein